MIQSKLRNRLGLVKAGKLVFLLQNVKGEISNRLVNSETV
jgi:hypothetical protein